MLALPTIRFTMFDSIKFISGPRGRKYAFFRSARLRLLQSSDLVMSCGKEVLNTPGMFTVCPVLLKVMCTNADAARSGDMSSRWCVELQQIQNRQRHSERTWFLMASARATCQGKEPNLTRYIGPGRRLLHKLNFSLNPPNPFTQKDLQPILLGNHWAAGADHSCGEFDALMPPWARPNFGATKEGGG